jgi:dsRNA-specific ribonuclease
MKRRKFYADLLTAIIAGLILSGLLAATLWFLARHRF